MDNFLWIDDVEGWQDSQMAFLELSDMSQVDHFHQQLEDVMEYADADFGLFSVSESLKTPSEKAYENIVPYKIGRDAWEDLKPIIREHYIDNGSTLEETMSHIKFSHNFSASKQQYIRKLNEWRFKKNRKNENWFSISYALKRRRINIDSADVYIDGTQIPAKKLKKEFSRRIRPTLEEKYVARRKVSPVPRLPRSPTGLLVRHQNCYSIVVSPPHALPWFDFLDSLNLVFDSLSNSQLFHPTETSCLTTSIDTRNLQKVIFGANDLVSGNCQQEDLHTLSASLLQRILPMIAERVPEDIEHAMHEMLTTDDWYKMLMLMTAYLVYLCTNCLSNDGAVEAWVKWLRNNKLHPLLRLVIDMQITSSQIFVDRLFASAVRQHDPWLLEQIATKVSDIDARVILHEGSFLSGLCWAVRTANLDMVKYLLSLGSNPNQCCCYVTHKIHKEKRCIRPMDLAALKRDTVELVDYFLHIDAPFDAIPMLYSVILNEGSPNLVLQILGHKTFAKLSAKSIKKMSSRRTNPLIAAITSCRSDIVEMLIEYGHYSPDVKMGFEKRSHQATGVIYIIPPMTSFSPLMCSIQFGHEDYPEMMDALIHAGANVNECICDYFTHDQDIESLDWESMCLGEIANCHYHDKWLREHCSRSPLQVAAASDNIRAVKELVKHNAYVEPCHGIPALVLSVIVGNYKMARFLLSCGADPNSFDEDGSCITSLMVAVAQNDIGLVALLLARGARIDLETNSGRGYELLVRLYYEQNRADLQRLILKYSQHVLDIRDKRPYTASSFITTDCVSTATYSPGWLTCESSLILQNLFKEHLSSAHGANVLAICLKAGLSVGFIDNTDRSAVIRALTDHCSWQVSAADKREESSTEKFDLLIEHGAKVGLIEFCHIVDHMEWELLTQQILRTPDCMTQALQAHLGDLREAINSQRYSALRNLLPGVVRTAKQAASGERMSKELCLGLYTLCIQMLAGYSCDDSDYVDSIKLLFEDRIHMNSMVSISALPASAVGEILGVHIYNDSDCMFVAPIHLLLSKIFLVDIEWKEYRSKLNILRFLVEHGSDVNLSPMVGGVTWWTPLQMVCVTDDSIQEAECLIEAGADVNAPASTSYFNNVPGRTALQAASSIGNLRLTEYLIAKGADVNALASSRDGGTALELAVSEGYFRIMQVLVEAGAVLDHVREDNRTIFDVAAENGRLDCLKYLLDKGEGRISVPEVCAKAATYAEKEGHGVIARFVSMYHFNSSARSARESQSKISA